MSFVHASQAKTSLKWLKQDSKKEAEKSHLFFLGTYFAHEMTKVNIVTVTRLTDSSLGKVVINQPKIADS